MSRTAKHMSIWFILLGIIYAYLFTWASNGYGYMGYYGYHRGPSFMYWGGSNTYYNRDLRSGSINGSSVRGGGPGSGK